MPSYDKFDELIDKIDVGERVEAKFFHNLLAWCQRDGEEFEMFMECGDSSTEQREMSMDRVNNSHNARVSFGSIKACGEGISVVGASQIIKLDVHFNPSMSHQAIGRAFGLDQESLLMCAKSKMKVQLFETILEDKGTLVACKGNCDQQNSLEAQNSDTLKVLNANVNRVMNHVVDNETTKSNKHMTDTCATTYIAHPPKSTEYNFSKDDMRAATELTKPISVGGLNFLHKEDKKVNVYILMNDRAVHWFLIVVDLQRRHVAFLNSSPLNKSNDFRCTFLSRMEKFTGC
ncbi:hypothetical protein Cgig2_008611 [Carnegiea gigantea]|uniref:Ubiquitin-like protease family profile domain-containing protein n=1 Tax=Carnegiea gigantea TaxID=171969 RepID=A0A9Q1JYH1_9CARY|nr:hypothetical protein Cgig2_008611 [Carnegiea gigantea]